MDNYEIADRFSLLSKLMDIHGENTFKSKSYSIAAYNIENLSIELDQLPDEKISSIQGIGETIGKKIIELFKTGKIKILEELIKKTPEGIFEILKVKGLGPKKISILWKEMDIKNIEELLMACKENKLLSQKGFGEKTQKSILESIEFLEAQKGSYLYAQVEQLGEDLLKLLQDTFSSQKIYLTGDLKRHAETIDVIEFVVPFSINNIKNKLENFAEFETTDIAQDYILYKYDNRIKVKIFASDEMHLIEKKFLTSGSPEFHSAFIKEFPGSSFKNHSKEEDIFRDLNLQYIPEYLREDAGIIDMAKKKTIPKFIKQEDVKGLIHCHSNWSDGSYTLEQLVKACIQKGFEYLVISDHSKAAYYAKGLTEDKIKAQHELVDELNQKYKSFKIFKSIESDILNDGSLDYSDNVLSTFDLVIASVHSNLQMNEIKAMQRLIKAIENPYTTILGHMTGRLLLGRSGFPVDHIKIIDACAANNVVLELNAHPKRLDMRWQWMAYALQKNVLISIDPDAHTIDEFDNIKYGVLTAQKGLLTKEKNLSSFSLEEFGNFLAKRKAEKNI